MNTMMPTRTEGEEFLGSWARSTGGLKNPRLPWREHSPLPSWHSNSAGTATEEEVMDSDDSWELGEHKGTVLVYLEKETGDFF
jgi:hypothetical protein